MDLVFATALLAAIVAIAAYWSKSTDYWQKHGIPCVQGAIPVIGNLLPVVIQKTTFTDLTVEFYNRYKGHSMVGFYAMGTPTLIVREPELAKTVLSTGFASFHKNATVLNADVDQLLAGNPFVTYGEPWSTGRKALTYAFSSGRLRMLSETVRGVCAKLDDYLAKMLSANGQVELELKDLFSRFTGEVVANAGFGVEGHCFAEGKRADSFLEIGKAVFEPTVVKSFGQLIAIHIPAVARWFNVGLIPNHVDRRFKRIVADAMEARRADDAPRNDFLQLMVDHERKNGKDIIDHNLLASHAFSFFGDGYETSSITLSFVAYHLATHPDVQTKLRQEVTTVLGKHDGVLTYEALKEMTYMDRVVSESQRMMPALGNFRKLCTNEFLLEGSDGLKHLAKPGTEIVIPLQAIQNDPDLWPDAAAFDPDRFAEERKQQIGKCTFMPFGDGPRMCVGMRMAILQMKACLASIVAKYSLRLSPKTKRPLTMVPGHFLSIPVGGIWAFVEPIANGEQF